MPRKSGTKVGERRPKRARPVAVEPPSRNRSGVWLHVDGPRPREAGGRFIGKWMLRLPSDLVDEVWAKVAAATQRGDLGISAKVSTLVNNEMNPHSEGPQTHVMFVYTADCRDADDVVRVLSALRVLGFSQRLSYKEDGATLANIYG